MKAKLLVNDKEIEVEISEEDFKKLSFQEENKKTGYERVVNDDYYFYENDGEIEEVNEANDFIDNQAYNSANYYSDKTVAENNVRADKLMRQLRRFAVEHRKEEIGWNKESYKYCIRYGYGIVGMDVFHDVLGRDFGQIYFDSEETAQLAINTFYDELIWYFTEYKDSL